ncbi:MAG TPA: hypothetical protein VMF30_10245 [Pirellulales bacterium]|nr:hypothetical protein [Pirellulales bacterium]
MNEPTEHEPLENGPRDIQPDGLDRLLEGWAAGRAASGEQLANLKQRILGELARPQVGSAADNAADSASHRPSGGQHQRAPEKNGRHSGPGQRGVWFLAVAASLLLAFATRHWLSVEPLPLPDSQVEPLAGRRGPGGPAGPPRQVAVAEHLGKESLAAKARLFAEMQAVFGDRFQWVAETADRVELGLAEEAPAAEPSPGPPTPTAAAPLAVQVVIERKEPGTGEWQTLWASEVIARDQEPIVLSGAEPTGPDSMGAESLALWAYRLPDGMLFVETALSRSGMVQANASSILEDNHTSQVEMTDGTGAEYRIFQSAAALDDDLG